MTAANVIMKNWSKAIATTRGIWTTYVFRTTQSRKIREKLQAAGFQSYQGSSTMFVLGDELAVVDAAPNATIKVANLQTYLELQAAITRRKDDLRTKGYHVTETAIWIQIADREFSFTPEQFAKMKKALKEGKVWEERGTIMVSGWSNPGVWKWSANAKEMMFDYGYEGPVELLEFLDVEVLHYYGNFHGMY